MRSGYHSSYQSRRSAKRLASKSKKRFIFTIIFIGILIYATFFWVLPFFIGGIGLIKNVVSPQKNNTNQAEDVAIAPPVLNIPYEATGTARINIPGYTTPNLKVKLYLDDNPDQTVNVASDGSFTFEDVSLAMGTNNIYGKTIDGDKESLPSKTIKLIYDNEKPPLLISEPEDGKKIQGGDKKVKVAGKTDPEIKVFVNGTQVIVNSDGSFSTDLPINEGNNTISIKAVDVAGNSTESQRNINYTP